jgi:hypothetical protein
VRGPKKTSRDRTGSRLLLSLLARLLETLLVKTTEDLRTQNQVQTIVPEELSQVFAD